MIIIFVVGAAAVTLALLLEAWYEPPYWLHMAIWPMVILGLSLGLLQPIKAFFVAQQFRHRSTAIRNSE